MQRTLWTLMAGFVLAALTIIGGAQTSTAGGASFDEVIASVDSASGAFDDANIKGEKFVLGRFAAAKKAFQEAKDKDSKGDRRGRSAKLKTAKRALSVIRQRVTNLTARKNIEETLRLALVAIIDEVIKEAKQL